MHFRPFFTPQTMTTKITTSGRNVEDDIRWLESMPSQLFKDLFVAKAPLHLPAYLEAIVPLKVMWEGPDTTGIARPTSTTFANLQKRTPAMGCL
jgi:hypothetical protein